MTARRTCRETPTNSYCWHCKERTTFQLLLGWQDDVSDSGGREERVVECTNRHAEQAEKTESVLVVQQAIGTGPKERHDAINVMRRRPKVDSQSPDDQ